MSTHSSSDVASFDFDVEEAIDALTPEVMIDAEKGVVLGMRNSVVVGGRRKADGGGAARHRPRSFASIRAIDR